MVHNWLENIQSFLYPATCLLCKAPGMDGRDVCLTCHTAFPSSATVCRRCALPLTGESSSRLCGECLHKPPSFDRAAIPYLYDEPLTGLIHRLKFHRDLKAGRLLGELLAEYLIQHLAQAEGDLPDAIIPVPMHASRLRRRGFNQAVEIAHPVAKALKLPLITDLCRRVRATSAQHGLHARERRSNLRRAFEMNGRSPYRRVVILDDVVTTGATVRELAATLRRGGVEEVLVWAVARAVKR